MLQRQYRNTRYFLDHPLLVNNELDRYIRKWRLFQKTLAILAGFTEPDDPEDPDPYIHDTYYIFNISIKRFNYMLKYLCTNTS
jgi:hypothetical protein